MNCQQFISSDMWYIILSFVSRFPYQYKLVSKSINSICNSIMDIEHKKMNDSYLYWNGKYGDKKYNDDILYYYLNKWALDSDWDYILYVSLYMKNMSLSIDIMELAHLFKRQDIVDEIIDTNPSIITNFIYPICIYNRKIRNMEYHLGIDDITEHCDYDPTEWIGYMTSEMKQEVSKCDIDNEKKYIDNYMFSLFDTYINGRVPWHKNDNESMPQYLVRINERYNFGDNDNIFEYFASNESLYEDIASMKPTDTYPLIMSRHHDFTGSKWYTDEMLRIIDKNKSQRKYIDIIIYERYLDSEIKQLYYDRLSTSLVFLVHLYNKYKDVHTLKQIDKITRPKDDSFTSFNIDEIEFDIGIEDIDTVE